MHAMRKGVVGAGFVGFLFTVMACRGSEAGRAGPSTDVCSKIGQSCTLSPGLLGICNLVSPDACDGGPCWACLGQH